MRTETTERTLYTFDELSESAQDKAIENLYDCNVDYDWWDIDAECFFGFDTDELKALKRAGATNTSAPLAFDKMYFNIDRGSYIQFPDLWIRDTDTFRRWLHIPSWLIDRLQFSFGHGYSRDGDTRLTIELDHPTRYDFTPREQKIVDRAEEICNDKILECLSILRREYEYRTSREAIVESIESNEWEFTEDGKLA